MNKRKGTIGLKLLFLGPAVIILFVMTMVPFIYALWISLHNYNIATGVSRFLGLSNYISVLTASRFDEIILNTVYIAFFSVIIELVLGLAFALLVYNIYQSRLRGPITTALTVPMMIAPIVIGLTFYYMYQYQFGVLNFFTQAIAGVRLNWIGTPLSAKWGIIFSDIWQWTPFMFVVLLAGLTTIPMDVYEAAAIDGASQLSIFRAITLVYLRPVILIILLFRLADALKLFDLIFIITGGGPGVASSTISFEAFKEAFDIFDFGVGTTLAMIALIINMTVCSILVRLMRRG